MVKTLSMSLLLLLVCSQMSLVQSAPLVLTDDDMKNLLRNGIKSVISATSKEPLTCDRCIVMQKEITEVTAAFFLAYKPITDLICQEVAAKSTDTLSGCETAVKRYIPIIQRAFLKLFVTHKNFLCGFILQECESDIQRFEVQPIIDQIYQGMPAPKEVKPTLKSTYKILQVNDIHIDLEYLPGGEANCKNGVVCCRANKVPNGESVKAGYWGTANGTCDLPQHTFWGFLDFAKSLNPDYVFWLGDNENHEVDTIEFPTNVQTTSLIAKAMSDTFDKKKVFLAIGNHEQFPIDNINFDDPLQTEFFFHNLVGAYKPLLNRDELTQMHKSGYYTSLVKERNLRVISVYSAPFDSLNFFLLVSTYDPDGAIQWLWDTLKAAEKNREDVMIIMHIPMGNDFSISLWCDLFNALVDRYQNSIKGIFSAHTHWDHLIFHRSRNDNNKIVKTDFVAPSLTTWTHLNPSFRVFEVDTETNEIVDYVQYRLDLDKYNAEGPSAKIAWDPVYSFKQQYGLTDLSNSSMQKLYANLKFEGPELLPYMTNFFTGFQKFTKVDQLVAIKLRCMMFSNSRDVFKCMGLLTPIVASDMFTTLILGNLYPAYMKFTN